MATRGTGTAATLTLALAILLLTFPPAEVKAQNVSDARRSCPITQPPEPPFVPPAHFPGPGDRFYLGSSTLWTALWLGTWHGVPDPHGSYRVKLPWFAVDIGPEDSRSPALSITGRRLDADSPPLRIEGPNVGTLPAYDFFASVLVFPSAGCWAITAKRNQSQVRFVVLVGQ